MASMLSLGLSVLALSGAATAAPAPRSAARLPDRTLDCVLGRARNIDPSKQQTVADVVYEGRYPLKLRLPSIPVRNGPPPDPAEDPEPVDPRTRIVSDPLGLMEKVAPAFHRVVDLWPERVEMIAQTPEVSANGIPLLRLIIVNSIDQARGTAGLFMTTAADAGSLDINSVYQGTCRITNTPSL